MTGQLDRLLAPLLYAVAASTPAIARPVDQRAATATTPVTLDVGTSRLTAHTYIYRPARTGVPAPLIVLLHGAGGDARRFLGEFERQADRRGVILLSLQSTQRSWPQRSVEVTSGADAANLNAAIGKLLANGTVDRERVVLLGFSDGASQALSLGLSNPSLFRAIVALSPGYAFAPSRSDTTQRIYIAHGRRDPVLPIANVRDGIVAGLERAGYRPKVRWFGGGHSVDTDALNEGLDFALDAAR